VIVTGAKSNAPPFLKSRKRGAPDNNQGTTN
jgi:hypothetical protein